MSKLTIEDLKKAMDEIKKIDFEPNVLKSLYKLYNFDVSKDLLIIPQLVVDQHPELQELAKELPNCKITSFLEDTMYFVKGGDFGASLIEKNLDMWNLYHS